MPSHGKGNGVIFAADQTSKAFSCLSRLVDACTGSVVTGCDHVKQASHQASTSRPGARNATRRVHVAAASSAEALASQCASATRGGFSPRAPANLPSAASQCAGHSAPRGPHVCAGGIDVSSTCWSRPGARMLGSCGPASVRRSSSQLGQQAGRRRLSLTYHPHPSAVPRAPFPRAGVWGGERSRPITPRRRRCRPRSA